MARLALKLLGSYRLTLDGHPIPNIESDKARALLAYLVVENDRPHSRDKLAGIFWAEQDEEHARGSLSQALYHLRGLLGDRPLTGILPAEPPATAKEPYLLVLPNEIKLNPKSDFEADVAAFTRLVSTCKAHAHPPRARCDECLERYIEAARLYAGDFLDGFYLPKCLAFEEWATILRERLRLEVLWVLEQLAAGYEASGDLEMALAHARRIVQLDGLSESGTQSVMRLLALLGRKGEALAQYRSFQQALAQQIGDEPGVETRTIYQLLRNGQAGNSLMSVPASSIPIIGRKQELQELWSMLRDPQCRLICIVGFGGSGKTRLAVEAARMQSFNFRDGVYFISLSALESGGSLLATIAEGLGFTFREFGDQKKQLLDYLRNKKVLLLLDSFETVVGSAGLVTEMLSASEGSKALVTSRVRLNLSGEQPYTLTGMKLPPPDATGTLLDYSSVELFLNAARRVEQGYTPDSLEGVARICQLVGGMPLGLLMASTWVSDFSTHEIADQIHQSLDFLSVEWADLPARQRSLRATFEYSWNMLNANEKQALMGISVFRNPFTTQAAFEVAGASPQVLHALVGKCLLGSIAKGTFQMHDLVRQYSEEKLTLAENDQERTIRQRHSEYFLENVVGWEKLLKGPRQSATLAESDKAIEDVKVAWRRAAQCADLERLMRASEGLFLYNLLRYRFLEGEHACQVAIETAQGKLDASKWMNLGGWLLVWQAQFNRLSGNLERARELAQDCLEILEQASAAGEDTRRGQALLWRERGYLTNNLEEQTDCFQRSAELFQVLGEIWWQALVLAWAGEIASRKGDRDQALSLHQQAVTLSQAAGAPYQHARSLINLAYIHLTHFEWQTGSRLMEKAANMFKSIGDMGSLANGELHLAISYGWTGRSHEASELLEQALVKLHQLGDHYYIAYGTLGLGVVQMHNGRYDQATLTLQEALQFARKNGYHREIASGLAQIGCLALVQGKHVEGLEDFQECVASLRKMGFAGELGTALGGLALAHHQLGQERQAWDVLTEALRIAVETHSRFTLLTLPASLVVMLADAARWEQSVEACAVLMTDPMVANSCWFVDMIGDRMEQAKKQLPEDIYQAAEARGQDGNVFEVLGRLAVEIDSWKEN